MDMGQASARMPLAMAANGPWPLILSHPKAHGHKSLTPDKSYHFLTSNASHAFPFKLSCVFTCQFLLKPSFYPRFYVHLHPIIGKIGRVTECAGLEIRYTLFGYRGFESLIFRFSMKMLG